MKYRRANIARASYFFTVVTYHRQPLFAAEKEVGLLRQSFKEVIRKYPFSINAIVILPDHLHCIWHLPKGDADLSTRWRFVDRNVLPMNCGENSVVLAANMGRE